MKLSKSAKARITRMSAADKKALVKSATFLPDVDCITADRAAAIARTVRNGMH